MHEALLSQPSEAEEGSVIDDIVVEGLSSAIASWRLGRRCPAAPEEQIDADASTFYEQVGVRR